MDLWDAVRDERTELVERLAGLTGAQWDSPSLCSQWRIRDVVGHVAAGAEGRYGMGALLGGLVRNGFSFNRWMAADGRERGMQDPSVILKALQEAAGNRKAPPGAPTVSVLTDVLIHSQDVYRPLGVHRTVPESHLPPVADFLRTTFVFGAKKRITGLKLTATDVGWSHGEGAEVTGPAEALVLVMAGRYVALDDLNGEGKSTLVARCTPQGSS